MQEKNSFILWELIDKLESDYPDKEIDYFAVLAYLERLGTTGLIEKARSGVGLDKEYRCHNPFADDEI
ncbi:MAG: hypothetical protein WC878_07605 [Candidatus Paceibacterota bacterium]|jgi:hypothetical protein